ncbi:MAG: tetrahydromethanopterin S-methyltransferase subunit D [Methermicoccaceae archaeon]
MDPLSILLITLGGIIITMAVHFVPVGGAPAAMAQTTGVGTGTTMLAAGSGLTGLVSAGFMLHVVGPSMGMLPLVLLSGAVGSMLMICVTMLMGNIVYIFGVGVPPVSAKVKYDPITKDRQDIYVSKGTEGHGIPTVSYVSGTLGGLFGGLGGALVYWALFTMNGNPGLSGIFAIGLFFMNAVIASYNITGTIEGFHDPKFKRLPKAILASAIATFIGALLASITVTGGV